MAEDQLHVPLSTIALTYILFTTFTTLNYFILAWTKLFGSDKKNRDVDEGLPPMYDSFSDFYVKYMYGRISDCWNRPICSSPGAYFDVMLREGTDFEQNLRLTGEVKRCMNLGSYNYLGFGDSAPDVKAEVKHCLKEMGPATGSTYMEAGYTTKHRELEARVAELVGKEDAVIFGMGYATNASNLPSIIGERCLIISDSLNHASLVVGCRSSAAKIKVFKHNDLEDLERVLRHAIIHGQPRTHRPWDKVMIVVEGIYSMEGDICPLPEIVALKKKYKAYLYVDEAHSIGALGSNGGGICDYWGVNPDDVDILMGTFSKSFAAAGGYIASSKALVDKIRASSYNTLYDSSMSLPCVQQILSALKIITGKDGTTRGADKIRQLRDNSNYFRKRLEDEGFLLIGDYDSPVIPVLVAHPAKFVLASRLLLESKNIGVAVVGYPACPMLLGRIRFCVSAGHTREDIDKLVDALLDVGDTILLRYGQKTRGKFVPHT